MDIKHMHFHSARADDDLEAVAQDELIAERNVVVDVILRILEDFRQVVINGNENLPPLDPLRISQLGPATVSLPP